MRQVAPVLVGLAVVVASPLSVRAGTYDTAGADADYDPDSGVISAVAAVNGVIYSSGSGPRCRWARLSQGQYEDMFNISVEVPDSAPSSPSAVSDAELTPEQVAERARLERERRDAEERERVRRATPSVVLKTQGGEAKDHGVYSVVCPSYAFAVRFVSLDVDVDDLIPGIRRFAEGRILPPVPDVNPAAATGGFVNLGMWLAVEPVSVDPVSAEAGPVWITVFPTHRSVSFKFGNGDDITCSGFGDPIVDLSSPDESEVCGYTYRQSSPDDAPYLLTSITTWDLPYESSAGPDTLGTFSRDTGQRYDVDEIQTVGQSN